MDTNVISELAPGKRPERDLRTWLILHELNLYMSVVTPLEIQTGILKLQRLSPGRRQEAMAAWYSQLDTSFRDRTLLLTREVSEHAAHIADAQAALGMAPDWPDTIIAATARHHDMVLLTRNVRHFANAGIEIVDPFDTLPK